MNSDIRSAWLGSLLSTEPADRPRAEAALRDLYAAAMPVGLAPPVHFFWFDSPFQAEWAVNILEAPTDEYTRRHLETAIRGKPGREIVESTRAALCRSARQEWDALTSIVGEKLHPRDSIRPMLARLQVHGDRREVYPKSYDGENLDRIEKSFRKVVIGILFDRGCGFGYTIQSSFYEFYAFCQMAVDEAACVGREVPPLLAAAWTVAHSAGLWWPFRGAVVLSERPVEMHLNQESLLHCEGGPAALFRDGTRVWAWNGNPMREEWMLHPEKLRPAELRDLDPTFQAYVKPRLAPLKRAPKVKPSAILKAALPADSEERVALLRHHNEGNLPLFDRYLVGEHRKVWEELVALGHLVRQDPHAADALAVAYETMSRVRANVRTIAARLKALGYEKGKDHDPLHRPPSAETRKLIARLEKEVRGMPLSLRAFYDVVGAVDWTGHHSAIAPPDGAVNPDPLVVEDIQTVLGYCEDGEDAGLIFIADDDVRKAGGRGSGGYAIEVPDLGADGKLTGERHDVYFVEYLRVAFRFGGFPGYDGIDSRPAELAGLSRGLLAF